MKLDTQTTFAAMTSNPLHPPYHPTHFVMELCIRLQMKSSAHTFFVMTTTLPHAPNLYWNYVLGYEIRPEGALRRPMTNDDQSHPTLFCSTTPGKVLRNSRRTSTTSNELRGSDLN